MSITIIPEKEHLCIAGDISAELTIPYESPDACEALIALSDGTLLGVGITDDGERKFTLEHPGAGMTFIENDEGRQFVFHNFRIEWATISPSAAGVRLAPSDGGTPLFPELERDAEPCKGAASAKLAKWFGPDNLTDNIPY